MGRQLVDWAKARDYTNVLVPAPLHNYDPYLSIQQGR